MAVVVIPNCLRNCFCQACGVHIEGLDFGFAGEQVPICKDRIDGLQLVEKIEETKCQGFRRVGARTPIGCDFILRIDHQLPPVGG